MSPTGEQNGDGQAENTPSAPDATPAAARKLGSASPASDPTDAVIGDSAFLGRRDRATHAELSRLDPRIADLFLYGHQLVARVERDPGAVYLLAHAGREISRGVVRALLDSDVGAFVSSGEDLPENEKNRETIGAVLGLPPKHASVTTWFRLNETFSKSCHLYVNVPSPKASEVADAFLAFTELLYGRVAPYFATAAELDALLAIATPSAVDITRAESLLTRRQQRTYFFSRLDHPAWLVPLVERGHFSNPPERIVHDDGRWQMTAWPEGEFLARIAPRAPLEVTNELASISLTILNPVVWAIVADAALVVPLGQSVVLAKQVAKALATVPPVLLPSKAVDLVKRLSGERDDSVWHLAQALLWTRQNSEAAQFAEDAPHLWQDGARQAKAALARLDAYELQRFCKDALPSLVSMNAKKTLKLLIRRLESVERFVRACGVASDDAQSSSRWCAFLENERDEDVRAVLAAAIARTAATLAKTDSSGAQTAWSMLQDATGDIFERIGIFVLANSDEHLKQEIDDVVGSGVLLDPPFGGREAALLLRKQFKRASPSARALFRYALERGPSAKSVRFRIDMHREFSESMEEGGDGSVERDGADVNSPAVTESTNQPSINTEIQEVVIAWQAQHLRWFHDQLPEDLRDLADRAGVRSEIPTAEQQSLDEVGFYAGTSSWSGSDTPKVFEDIATMSPADIVTLLNEWRPTDGDRGISYFGLERALTEYAEAHAGPATEVLSLASTQLVRPEYLSALLAGLRAPKTDALGVSWATLLTAAMQVVSAADRAISGEIVARQTLPDSSADQDAWSSVAGSVADFIRAGLIRDGLPAEASSSVWDLMQLLFRSPAVWRAASTPKGAVGLEGALVEALNTASGRTVRAAIDAGLWEYRIRERFSVDAGKAAEGITRIEALLAPLLTRAMEHEGEETRATTAMMGQLAPQLHLISPEWFTASKARLFEGAGGDTARHPGWGAYLLRSRLYEATFRELRPWYALSAATLNANAGQSEASDGSAKSSDGWSMSRGLASHVLTAFILGLADLEEADALVENTFANVPPDERARVYWEVFRGWSDVSHPPDPEIATRILRFWEWRLSQLESASPSPERNVEAEGLIWFLMTPHLPAVQVIQLGRRALKLGLHRSTSAPHPWSRLGALAKVDAGGAFEMASLLVEDELGKPYAHLLFEEVAPVLQAALNCGDARVTEEANRLIHRLGAAGMHQYGQLLADD